MTKVSYLDNSVLINDCLFTKEFIYEQYILLNKSSCEMATDLGVSLSCFDRIRKYLKIKKDNGLVSKNRKKALLLKYGVENVSQITEVKNKKINSAIKKYGVSNISQSAEVQSKKEKTFL